MNFPEVPFDENLFSSNKLLKSYWERSTENRSAATIPDWPSEESEDHSDLRTASKEQWASSQAERQAERQAEGQDAFFAPILENNFDARPKSVDALVDPKMSGSNIAVIIVVSIAAALLLAYLFISMGYSNKTVYSPRRSSPRRF